MPNLPKTDLPKKRSEDNSSLEGLQEELRQAKAQIHQLDQLSRTLHHQITNMITSPAIAVLHPANRTIHQQELHQQFHLPGYFNPNSNPNYQSIVTDQRVPDQNTNMNFLAVPTQAYNMEIPNTQKPNEEFPALTVDKEKESKPEEDKPSYAMVASND